MFALYSNDISYVKWSLSLGLYANHLSPMERAQGPETVFLVQGAPELRSKRRASTGSSPGSTSRGSPRRTSPYLLSPAAQYPAA